MSMSMTMTITNDAQQISDLARQQVLSTLFSPAFPVGSFSYSHGLEAAIELGGPGEDRGIADMPAQIDAWIRACLVAGSGRNDAILMANAWRGEDVNDLAFALCAGYERWQEMSELGQNFARAANGIFDTTLDDGLAYPVAVGLATRQLHLDLDGSLTFFLQSFVGNLVSIATRAVPLGQTAGQKILANMLPLIHEIATKSAIASLDDLGGYAFMVDHASLAHENLETRIYRT
jgi:urease accessory protein